MRIWIDADACPKIIKELLFRAAARTKTPLVLVSNHALSSPPSPYISKMQVPSGLDAADSKIVQNLQPGELVVTSDIPLANLVIEKGGQALSHRGVLFTESNIKERLSMRNFSTDLRSSGIITGGPPVLSKREIQNFANELDKILTK